MAIFSSMKAQGLGILTKKTRAPPSVSLSTLIVLPKHSLEKFLDVIENTGFDLIGGLVGGESMIVGPSNSFFNNWLNYGNYKIKKGASGNCISREFGFRG